MDRSAPTSHPRRRAGARPLLLLDLLFALAVGACGGGGGDGTDTGPPLGIGPSSPVPVPAPAPTPPQAGAPGVAPTAPAAAMYALVLLDANGQAGATSLNANGQVAFAVATPAGPRARFFDGQRVLVVAGDAPGRAVAVNEAGQVAGELLQASGGTRAFAWSASAPDTVSAVDVQPGTDMQVAGINRSGLVAGTIARRNLPAPFVWTPGNPLVQGLPAIENGAPLPTASARALNDAGAVAGTTAGPGGGVHAALWPAGAPGRDLGTFGGLESSAAGLNAANQVVGQADLPGGTHHAFLWSDAGGLQDLGTLGGANSAALAVNASGWVAGTADTADGQARAFVWRASAMESLGTLGGAGSAATVMNAAGQVGGTAQTASGTPHAFLWSPSAGMVDLNGRLAAGAQPELQSVIALADDGALLASSSAGLVLLRPTAP